MVTEDTYREDGAVVQPDGGVEGVITGRHTSAGARVKDLSEVTTLGDARVCLAARCLESLQLLFLLHANAYVGLRRKGRRKAHGKGMIDFYSGLGSDASPEEELLVLCVHNFDTA